MTCIEMFLHADYYCKHPLFLSTFSNHRECFSSVNNILKACVSDASFNTDLDSENLVQHEAISNFVMKVIYQQLDILYQITLFL